MVGSEGGEGAGHYASEGPLELWWKQSLQSWVWVWLEQSDSSHQLATQPLLSKNISSFSKYFHNFVVRPDNIFISILSLLQRVSWPSHRNVTK